MKTLAEPLREGIDSHIEEGGYEEEDDELVHLVFGDGAVDEKAEGGDAEDAEDDEEEEASDEASEEEEETAASAE